MADSNAIDFRPSGTVAQMVLQLNDEIDPEDLLHADAHSRERQLEIVGIWHTHPDHSARPSATDRERA